MASIVSIKEALDSVTASAEGRAEHVFTVTNQVARRQPVGVQVLADPGADSNWFRIEGSSEREFDEGASYQIKVLFEAPAGTAPGVYAFKLLVYSAIKGRADEDFTEGPTVGVTVPVPDAEPEPEPEVPKKKLPWWMIAVAAVVVIAIGLGVFFLVRGGGFGSVIVGVGTDGRVYTRDDLNSDWQQLALKGPSILAVGVHKDGTLLGIGRDNKLYTRAAPKSDWAQAPDKGGPPMKAVAVASDGTILNVDTGNNVHTRKTLDDAPAIVTGQPCCVTDLALMNDGQIVAIGMDSKTLYTKTAPAAAWVRQKTAALVVRSVTVMQDGTLLGVGSDNKLWTRKTLAEEWVRAPDKGRTMVNVAVKNSKL